MHYNRWHAHPWTTMFIHLRVKLMQKDIRQINIESLMSSTIKVTPRSNGAIITINGLDIEITVRPSEVPPEEREASAPPRSHVEATVEPAATPPSRITVESIKRDLGTYLEDLDVSEDDEKVVVTPKRYLGHKKFVSISSLVEEVGGTYVSAGRKSRFLIEKKRSS